MHVHRMSLAVVVFFAFPSYGLLRFKGAFRRITQYTITRF